jgi:Protein of unknown function (DUF1573)
MRTRIFALMLSIVICVAARAELKWEQIVVELHPTPVDKQAIGHFKYQNAGNKPVRFKSVRTSCGCTAAQSQKEEVPPGEKGEITATFNIGGRTGTQVKTVTVETDDPTNATTVLTLKAVIPQEIEINPAFVFWGQGEIPNPKTIVVRAGKDFPLKDLKATSSNPNFQAKVKHTGSGEFKIDVQPRETTRPTSATLTIQPENSAKMFYATARVINAPVVQ